MKFSFNAVTQVLAIVGQMVNALQPSKYQILVLGVIAGLQGIVGTLAHFYNADGSKSAVGFGDSK